MKQKYTNTLAMAKKPNQLTMPKVHSSLCVLSLSLPVLALSNQALAEETTYELDTLQVEERTLDTNPYAEAGAPYKAKISGDKRHVKDLAETPQTISVLTQTQIRDSGKTDLKDVLAAQPGITLGTGENGNAFGDRYIIRGHEARSDIFVDGLRDPGMTTRESFATEQIEITKGPSATFAGRGSTGGAVNSISKQASTEYDFNKADASIGSDNYRRVSLDSNQRINDEFAVRANVMHSYKEVPDRDPAEKERNGVALSGVYANDNGLKLVADYYHLNAKDKPDLGTYIIPDGRPVSDLEPYAQDEDFLDSKVDAFTFRAEKEINEKLSVQNTLRYGTTENGYVVTGARGTTRAATDPTAPGEDTISLSTHQGYQDVEYVANQFNVYFDTSIADRTHQFVASVEYSDMSVDNGVYNVTNNGATNCVVSGRRGDSDGYCIVDANGETIDNIDSLMQRHIVKGDLDAEYNIKTTSLSLMDTVEISDTWSVFAGIRADHFDYTNDTSGGDYDYSDTLWNYHLGTVHDIGENGNVYFTYSTATNINGGESDLGGNCGYGGLCGDPDEVSAHAEPEKTENLELGTKWNINDGKLLFTAAIFQITKKDVMEGEDYSTVGTLNTGENRVKGFELSLSGNITDKLSTQAGLTVMDAEILKSVTPANEGETLSNFADDSVYVQLRYQATPKFSFGGTVTYSSELYAGQPDSAASDTYMVPSYTVLDIFANYQINERLAAYMNVGNLTDRNYYQASYRSGAFTYIGDARNLKFGVTYEY